MWNIGRGNNLIEWVIVHISSGLEGTWSVKSFLTNGEFFTNWEAESKMNITALVDITFRLEQNYNLYAAAYIEVRQMRYEKLCFTLLLEPLVFAENLGNFKRHKQQL